MSLILFGSLMLVFYACIWFFDAVFKSCMHYPYYAFLNGTGLSFGFCRFTWTTTAFNRSIYRWSKRFSRFFGKWYTFGYLFTIFLFLPFSILALFTTIIQNLAVEIEVNSFPEVKAVIPGVNMPLSDFWIYFVPIALSSIFHELGHALAAAQENISVLSFGFIVFAVIPLAFVEINTDINTLPLHKTLKIYCAGIWHNIILSFIAMILLFIMPIILDIGYEFGIGVRIKEVKSSSPLKGEKGLFINDVITNINGCPIKVYNDWFTCLYEAQRKDAGMCISHKYISQSEAAMESYRGDLNAEDCCNGEPDMICFEYVQPLHPESTVSGHSACLNLREVVDTHSYHSCLEGDSNTCPSGLNCLKPVLNNATFQFVIDRKDDYSVIYIGGVYDIYKSVSVDQYFPRNSFFAKFSPQQLEKFLLYVFTFSMGIAFMNVLPCYATDGHHIARNLIQLMAKKFSKGEDFITFFTTFTVVLGTGITIPTMIFLFAKTIYTHYY